MAEFKKILKRIKRSLKPFYFPFATKLFLVWLLAMFIGFLLSKYLYHVSFDYIITKLYDWDGGWYLRIIRHGYPSLKGHPSKFGNKALAFFPGYPILISAIAWIIHVPLEVAGILISWVAFFVTLHLSYYLLTNTWHKQKPFSRYAITLLALNPFSFWFGMLYTEALYIMLVTIIFICLGKKKYVWAAIAAGLASSVKDLGVFLGLVIVLDYIFSEKKSIVKSLIDYKTYLLGLISISGIVAYMSYLKIHTGNALAFVKAERNFGRGTGFSGFENNFSTIIHKFGTYAIWPYTLSAAAFLAILGIVAGIWLFRQRSTKSYGLYLILVSIFPLTTGTLDSLNRFNMIYIGIYMLVATLSFRKPVLRYTVLFGSVVLLIIFIVILCSPKHPLLG